MKKILFLAAAAIFMASCTPKPMKLVFEPLPMHYGDTSRSPIPFAKDPTVIRLGDEYLMYYSVTAFVPDTMPGKPPVFTDWHSAIARSKDLVNWTRVGDLDLRDSKGNSIYGAVAPCVRKLDGKIHIFYQRAWEGTDGVSNIWHAMSEDGITFTNTCDRPIIVPETNWSIKRSIDAEVYRVKDKLILLFATRDTTATYQIMGMAEAPYGCDYGPDKWTLLSTDGPLMKPEYPWEMSCTEAPTVVKHKGVWYMFYAGAFNHEKQQIGLCTSTDGYHFTRIQPDGLCYTSGPEGSWNAWESGHPGVFQDDDGQVYLFYQGKSGLNETYYLSVSKVFFEKPNAKSDSKTAGTETLTIHNPVIPGYHPDPSICRVGDDYYIVNSSFQYFPGVPVHHSKDLVNWELVGNVLDRESQIPLERANSWGGIFATTIRYHEGLFYMITTNVTKGGNFFVTAKDPAGPWSEPVYLKQGGIDPSFLFENGKCYMVSNPDGIQLCEVDPVTGEQLTESKLLWKGTGGRYPEGPHVYKKDGWYYLLISEGGTEMGHSLTIARSRDIWGPYESNPANPILTQFRSVAQGNQIQGTGHGDFVQAPDGSWWVVFLAFRRYGGDYHHLGRETFLAPVTWENGWPVINGGKPVEAEMEVPASWTAEAPVPSSWKQEFDGPLGPEWIFIHNPDSTRYRIADGVLALKGNTPLEENDHPTFVGVRQESPAVSVETSVRLDSRSGEAGLVVYQNNEGFASVGIRNGKAVLRVKLKALEANLGEVAVKGNQAVINVSSKDGMMYDFMVDGKPLGNLNTLLFSSEVAGGFTGVTLGMYAVGGTAQFEYFDYKED